MHAKYALSDLLHVVGSEDHHCSCAGVRGGGFDVLIALSPRPAPGLASMVMLLVTIKQEENLAPKAAYMLRDLS